MDFLDLAKWMMSANIYQKNIVSLTSFFAMIILTLKKFKSVTPMKPKTLPYMAMACVVCPLSFFQTMDILSSPAVIALHGWENYLLICGYINSPNVLRIYLLSTTMSLIYFRKFFNMRRVGISMIYFTVFAWVMGHIFGTTWIMMLSGIQQVIFYFLCYIPTWILLFIFYWKCFKKELPQVWKVD